MHMPEMHMPEMPAPECPKCETEPWVVLSAFTVDDGIVKLEQCDCRRHVNSYGNYWWSCGEKRSEHPIDIAPPPPPADTIT
jgi:hypothetical protein